MRPFHSVTVRFGPPLAYGTDGRRVVTGSRAPGDTLPGADGAAAPGPEELRALTDALMPPSPACRARSTWTSTPAGRGRRPRDGDRRGGDPGA